MNTLLCIGDIHLGRPARRLPSHFDGRRFGPTAAWRASVDAAIERKVAAVLLAGDVVDQDNRYFESRPVLEEGVRRLVDAGIEVIAVSGNHDADVLPRLASGLSGLRLLGAGGTWETHPIRREGRIVARVIGWSFPGSVVTTSPLETLEIDAPDDAPLIGLLHGDLDQPRSRYAPLHRLELEAATKVRAWLLGHVHVPSAAALLEPRPVGYLGSLVGLDPTETGRRGPWLMHLESGRPRMEHLGLAPLRWERREVPVDDLEHLRDLEPLIVEQLRALHDAIAPELGACRAVGVRLELTGRAESSAAIDDALASLNENVELFSVIHDDVTYFIDDRIRSRVGLRLDLPSMARESDPAAVLARIILSLEPDADPAGRTALLDRARHELAATVSKAAWASLPRDDVASDEALARRLRESGTRALEALLATSREVADAD